VKGVREVTEYKIELEGTIREACRRQYREEGNVDNPYEKGTIKRILWSSEAQKIQFDYDGGL
jgi:hypothetical protein